ncbi:ABC transporter permease [Occultella glacieicola]|uniref:ABC transporter permease n=1 Tax=Occultella glacieicola TaxID=2518684 RepID=UPI0014051B25|nr:polyketide antibiotic transporter [Occultella glacieicola]
MTATTQTHHAAHRAPADRQRRSGTSVREPWAGTGQLLRLALRRDRIRILIWFVAIVGTVAATVPALEVAYPDAAARQARAAILTNPSAVMMTGPAFGLDDYTLGAMVANELSLSLFVTVAVMSVLLTVRHTRSEEEAGRTELLRGLPVGHYAPATAALVHVAGVNLVIGAGTALALLGGGLEVAGSAAMGLATAVTGLVFGAVAAVTTQVTAHARAATGMAMVVLAAAFVARGVGDVIDSQGSWLSWLSPLAWAQQTRLFVDLRWWPLALSLALTVVLLAVSVRLARRRDLGAGLRPERGGRAAANPILLSGQGLALRLLRGTIIGWSVGLVLMAITFGSLANSLEDMLAEVPDLGAWIGMGGGDLIDAFAGAMLSFLVFGVGAFAVGAVLRLKTEEEGGRGEAVLATGASRLGWVANWFAVVVVASIVMLVLSGLGLGLGVQAATGSADAIGRLAVSSLAYLPAVLVMAALALALFGLVPPLAGLAWVLVAWVVFVGWVGALLDLPAGLMGISPVDRTPTVPVEAADPGPLLVLTAIAAVLTIGGLLGIRRRDIRSS